MPLMDWTRYGSNYARERNHSKLVTHAPNGRAANWYIAYLGEPGSNALIEEVDLDATSREAARLHARAVISKDYPGMRLVRLTLA